jgi:zinc protease
MSRARATAAAAAAPTDYELVIESHQAAAKGRASRAVPPLDEAARLVEVDVVLRHGSGHDPVDRPGVAFLCAELCRRGAGGKSRAQLDEAFDALGGELHIDVSAERVWVSTAVLADRLEAALQMIADVLARPHLSPDELVLLKREVQAEMEAERDDDETLAARTRRVAVFAGHPYGHDPRGTLASHEVIDVDTLRAWHAAHYRRGGMLVGLAGSIDTATAERVVRATLGQLPAGAVHVMPIPAVTWRAGRRLVLCDKPERTQVQAHLVRSAPVVRSPDYVPLDVANTAFGGTFTARLMQEVRAKRGLSYGAYSRLGTAPATTSLDTWVFPEQAKAAETLDLILGLLEDYCTHGPTAAEVKFARRYRAGSYLLDNDPPGRRLARRLDARLLGLSDAWVKSYADRIAAVTTAQARHACRSYDPADLTVVVVCTAAEVRSQLEACVGVKAEVLDFRSL